MSKEVNIIGQKFGQLVVLSKVEERNKDGKIRLVCRCDCGEMAIVKKDHLKSGTTRSCGCLHRETARKLGRKYGRENGIKGMKHGATRDGMEERLYTTWATMRKRCRNPNHNDYKYYGLKGIKVCQEWDESYKSFRSWAANSGYRDDLVIHRISNDENYEPLNCTWMTKSDHSRLHNKERRTKSND